MVAKSKLSLPVLERTLLPVFKAVVAGPKVKGQKYFQLSWPDLVKALPTPKNYRRIWSYAGVIDNLNDLLSTTKWARELDGEFTLLAHPDCAIAFLVPNPNPYGKDFIDIDDDNDELVDPREKAKKVAVPLYESCCGHAWSGRGPKPNWLKSELERGEPLIDFLNPKHPEYEAYKAKLSKK